MNRGRALIFTLALCGLAAIVLPAAALARTAYYTGATGEAEGYAAPIELSTGALGTPIPILTEGPPSEVAITPDGSTAYVTAYGELVPIDVATDTEGTPLSLPGAEPRGLAIAPDGKHAYTANGYLETVSVIDLATGTEVGSPIAVEGRAEGIAVTPDGSRAYVSIFDKDKVDVIDLATDTLIGSIPVGAGPHGIAVTPNGSRVLVANSGEETVSEIDTATDTVVKTVAVGAPTGELAISPDGTHAYVVGSKFVVQTAEAALTPIDIAAGTAGTPVPVPGNASDIAILPDGSRAYVAATEEEEPEPATASVLPFDLATNTLESGFAAGELIKALAIVPNQPPHAVIEGPGTATAGDEVSLDGSKSFDTDGTVARYDWSFGDGTGAANGGPTVHHTYANPGTYQVTLTTTDNEGCSTELIFTGQTAYCNGSGVARTTHDVVVSAPPATSTPAPATSTPTPATPRTIARCAAAVGSAGSFVPKIRPGHVVSGVRVRLAVGTPSKLYVKAKLFWSVKGKKGRAKLHGLSVKVHRWRRVRFAIPSKLRKLLPLHKRVTLKLAIRTTPLSGPACSGAKTQKTLHLRVVKVFPHAVQAH